MADGGADRPNETAPVSLQQLREALAFVTGQYKSIADGSKNVVVWLWEAIQGDFNQERSAGQITFDTAIALIPGVDQVCDVRDIIANCRQINEDKSNTWAWVGLVLTLIGLFPTLGSLVKGVLKIFFLFVRRFGLNHLVRAVDEAMSWVITFLRRREVARYWKRWKWDRLFMELARQVKEVRGLVSPALLLRSFDRAIALMRNLLGQVSHLPFVGSAARETIELVTSIRGMFNQYIGMALKPVQDVLDAIVHRLELEDLVQRRGVLDTGNVHFSGTLPEAHAVTLMRRVDPPPAWLSVGQPSTNPPLVPSALRSKVDTDAANGYPQLSDPQIESFAKLRKDTLIGPMKLYRVVSPGNFGAGSDWMTEEVFNALQRASDPKAAWRKNLAVWPDWNPNGQFVVYDIKPGEKLKVWRGEASAQTKDHLPDRYLEGGYEQIKFDGSIVYDAEGRALLDSNNKVRTAPDSRAFYDVNPTNGALTPSTMTHDVWRHLPPHEQVKYQSLRTEITHPSILGPFDTRWGSTDFGSQLNDVRLGLPHLPGQITKN